MRFGQDTLNDRDIITVGSHVQSKLTCTPSPSRPTTTVVWYIGNSEIKRGSETTLNYLFKDEEHGQQIYCKASNFQGDRGASSVTLKLDVQGMIYLAIIIMIPRAFP